MKEQTNLSDLKNGEKALIVSSDNEPAMKRRLFDLGFVPGSITECVLTAPLGDPKAYLIKNALIALRQEDSERVRVKKF